MTAISTRRSRCPNNDRFGNPAGSQAAPRFSPDGRKLAFVGTGPEIVSGFPAVSSDLYLRDLQTGAVELVSLAPGGTVGGNFVTGAGEFTPDGRAIVFPSSSSTLDGRPVAPGVPSLFIARLTPDPAVDLAVTAERLTEPVEGAAWTVQLTVVNNGPEPALSVRLAYLLPYVGAGSTASTGDGTCATIIGSNGSVVFDCTLGGLEPGETHTVQVSNPFPLAPNDQPSVVHVNGPRLHDPQPEDNTATLILDNP